MRHVTNQLTLASVTCMQRVVSQVRKMPDVDRIPAAELSLVAPADLAPAADRDTANPVPERLTLGPRISVAARAMLAKLHPRRAGNGAEVRVLRTAQDRATVIPAQPAPGNVTIRDVALRLPFVMLQRDLAVVEDPRYLGDIDSLAIIRAEASVASLVACHDLVWSAASVDTQEPEAALPADLHQLLMELAAGATDAQAAGNLHISHRTVSRHVAELLQWLGASSRLQAGVIAARYGLV